MIDSKLNRHAPATQLYTLTCAFLVATSCAAASCEANSSPDSGEPGQAIPADPAAAMATTQTGPSAGAPGQMAANGAAAAGANSAPVKGGAASTQSPASSAAADTAQGTGVAGAAARPTGDASATANGDTTAAGAAAPGVGAAGAGDVTGTSPAAMSAGAAGAGPDATTTDGAAGAATEPDPAEHEDLGMGDGSDVVTIGDSWMNYAVNGGGIEAGLLAASMQPYRTYGVAGTMLLDEVIPNQYETAKRQNPDIKTIVMTGGGNDLLLTGMTTAGCGSGCKMTIDRVTARLKELWDEMAADGVQDLVYIEYSRGGSNEPGVSYANEVIPPVCAAAPVRCHFIDSDLIIDMQLIDGVHPTPDGCQKLGKAVFDLMVEKGMRR